MNKLLTELKNVPNEVYEELHESRKRSKDLRYRLELRRPTWPELVGPMAVPLIAAMSDNLKSG